MAPKRQGSFLTRGRQRVQQTQQMKQASARQLPPKGGTGANKPKATAQRTATAVTQRVRQDVATLRALGENMKRNQARAERQIPADKSPSVRRVGPGGANPKPQGQLPPGQRGGGLATRGGALATRDGGPIRSRGGQVTPPRPNGGPVRPVSVRDLGNNRPQMGGGGGRPLPPGQGGGTAAPRPGSAPRLPGGGRAPIRLGGLRGGLIAAVGGMAADALGRRAGEAIGGFMRDQTNQSRNDARTNLPGGRSNSGRSSGKPATDGRYVPGNQQVSIKPPAPKPKPPTAPASSGSRSSSSSGGNTSSGRSSAPSRPAAKPPSRPSASSAPKPPNLPKVEVDTTDAPKAPEPSKPAMKELKIRRGVGRDEMIQENLRRARRKSS